MRLPKTKLISQIIPNYNPETKAKIKHSRTTCLIGLRKTLVDGVAADDDVASTHRLHSTQNLSCSIPRLTPQILALIERPLPAQDPLLFCRPCQRLVATAVDAIAIAVDIVPSGVAAAEAAAAAPATVLLHLSLVAPPLSTSSR